MEWLEHQSLYGIAVLLLAIVWGIKSLIKTMSGTYQTMIATLSQQNVEQQKQITKLESDVAGLIKEIDQGRDDCSERMNKLEQEYKTKMESLQNDLEKIRKQCPLFSGVGTCAIMSNGDR